MSELIFTGDTLNQGRIKINGIASGTTLNLWSASTGSNSIIRNNSAGNLASSTWSSVLGGTSCSSTTQGWAIVVGGNQNKSAGQYSILCNGAYNLVSGNASFLGNGYNSKVTGNNSFLGNGSFCLNGGSSSFIGAGLRNSATTNNYSTIINGKQNQSQSTYGFIGNGLLNSAGTTSYSNTVLNGKYNLADGGLSTIIGSYASQARVGTGTIIGSSGCIINSGAQSTIINLKNITTNQGLRVYVPDLQITSTNSQNRTLFIQTGVTNSTFGTVVLVSGVAIISTNLVSASTVVFLTVQSLGGTPGYLAVTARSNATSFTITSSSLLDTSTVGWWIVQQV
jgi:hypothetical protein